MPENGCEIRDATAADMARLCAIYREYVLHGLASFEETPPDRATFSGRWRDVVAQGLPWLVAKFDDEVAGYAYAAPYRPRPGYRYAVEDSVYVAPQWQRRGVARELLSRVIARCTERGLRQMVAVIGDSENTGSIRLHAGLGFREVGVLRGVGFKLGRWVDVVVMQRALGPGAEILPDDAVTRR